MANTPVYSQLPDVGDDVESMRAWAKVVNQILRTLIGNGEGHMNTVTVTSQGNPTQQQPRGLHDGDLWIVLPTRQGQQVQRSVWSGAQWISMNGLW